MVSPGMLKMAQCWCSLVAVEPHRGEMVWKTGSDCRLGHMLAVDASRPVVSKGFDGSVGRKVPMQ
jgi:hypothetical protein